MDDINENNKDRNLNSPDSSCNPASSSQSTDVNAKISTCTTNAVLVDPSCNFSCENDENTVTSSTNETKLPLINNEQSEEKITEPVSRKPKSLLKITKKRRRIITLDDENSEEEVSVDIDGEDKLFCDNIERSSDSEASIAKNLLKRAAIIRVPNMKKRARILDSDDEDDLLKTSVDDIGLLDDREPKSDDDELNNESIVSETIFSDATQEIRGNKENCSNEILSKSGKEKSGSSNCDDDEVKYFDEDVQKIEIDNADDNFYRFEESDLEDSSNIPNDEYFGTPDKAATSKARIRGPKNSRRQGPREKKSTKFKNYDKDFVVLSDQDSSSDEPSHSTTNSDSDPDSVSSSSSSATCSNIVRKHESVKIIQPQRILGFKRKKKRDRFYDKSRNIPNDIYFGDVKVPLHILHSAWNSDHDTSQSEPETISCTFSSIKNVKENLRSPPSNSRLSIPPQDMTQLSMLKEFVQIVGIKINYSKLFEKVSSTNEKCRLIRRILYSKGLRGEPTVAKCKELKKEIQARKESLELDKTVIIKTEGRTRRSTRHDVESASELHKNVTIVKPETLQTLSRLKSVIDSDASE